MKTDRGHSQEWPHWPTGIVAAPVILTGGSFFNAQLRPRRQGLKVLGVIKVDFQVNGETYFLSLAENERHWEVFVSTETRARPVPVYEDAPEFRELAIVVEEDKGRRRLPN